MTSRSKAADERGGGSADRRRKDGACIPADEQRRATWRRLLLPAAAVVVVLVIVAVGAWVLANRNGDGGGTASRSTTTAAETGPSPQGDEVDTLPAGVSDLGDLGDLSDTTELRSRVDGALRNPPSAPRLSAPACLDRALTGSPTPTAFGTGSHRGRPVVVLVLPASGNRETAVLLHQETCRAVSVVNLL